MQLLSTFEHALKTFAPEKIILNTRWGTTTPYYCPQFPVIVHSSISGIIDYKTLPQIDLYIVA